MDKRTIGVAGLALTLSACGGGKDPLAQLCVDEAAKGLEGQVYRLDEKALAASKKVGEDGTVTYKGEVILKPGTSGEYKQFLDCVVEPPTGNSPGRVLRFFFNTAGAGLAN